MEILSSGGHKSQHNTQLTETTFQVLSCCLQPREWRGRGALAFYHFPSLPHHPGPAETLLGPPPLGLGHWASTKKSQCPVPGTLPSGTPGLTLHPLPLEPGTWPTHHLHVPGRLLLSSSPVLGGAGPATPHLGGSPTIPLSIRQHGPHPSMRSESPTKGALAPRTPGTL